MIPLIGPLWSAIVGGGDLKFGTLDWRDRPASSPAGGWLIQSRAGKNGNFEVVIPWPDGGLAHFARMNDIEPEFPWRGPTLFGSGRYTGASVTESDFTAFASASIKNLEVVAIREDGVIEHWWRENGGAFVWRRSDTESGGRGAPTIVYSGSRFLVGPLGNLESHGPSRLYRVVSRPEGSFSLQVRFHSDDDISAWGNIDGPPVSLTFPGMISGRNFLGVSIALTTWHAPLAQAGWKNLQNDSPHALIFGDFLIAAVTDDGALHLFAYGIGDWFAGETITVPQDSGQELRPFQGAPSILQSDHGIEKDDDFIPFDPARGGNIELACAAKGGGIILMARRTGGENEANFLSNNWFGPTRVGTAQYDAVSLIQSNFGTTERGNFEMVARAAGQRGFDVYFRDENLVWHGPHQVTGTVTTISSVSQGLSVPDTLGALMSINVDFSVLETDIREWLGDPLFTPYPAIAQALFHIVQSRSLRAAVFIDVIVFNYEENPGVVSPRRVEDVDTGKLSKAILNGFNNRYGTEHVALDALLE